MLKQNVRLGLVLLFIFLLLPLTFQAKGVLDTSFGNGGRASIQYQLSDAMFIQPDNKIIFASFDGGSNVHIYRFNENGSIDSSFNGGAPKYLWTGFGGGVKIQSDNKILAIGTLRRHFQNPEDRISIICRLNPDGSSDETFAGGCFSVNRLPVPVNSSTDGEHFADMVVLSDGKILALIGGFAKTELLRLNADGTPDIRYGTNGYAPVNVPASQTHSLRPVANGKYLVVGDGAISRIDGNGVIDPSFGSNGTVTVLRLEDAAIQPDGKIIIAADQSRRLTSDGQPDSSFLFRGKSSQIEMFPDGRILIRGFDIADSNRRVVYVLSNNGRIIGRERTAYSGIKILNSGKFLAVIGGYPLKSLDRFKSVTSIANGIGDMDGDEKSDIGVYRPDIYTFYVLKSQLGYQNYPAPYSVGTIFNEDFNGDFQSETAWWTPGSPQSCYYGFYFASNIYSGCTTWGLPTDEAVKGDYDGDHKTDFAIFRDGLWHIRKSSNGESLYYNWGQAGDKPVPADYDYDGITDAAIYRPSTGVWWVLRSSDFTYTAVQFGISEDKPVQADYDGDGRADFAVYRPSSGVWYLLKSTEGFAAAGFGLSSDAPVPGDYDGDGLTDIAVFRPEDGNWYLLQSKNGFNVVHFGQNGDVPLSTAYAANN